MEAINLPVTAVVTLMLGCTILAIAFVEGAPMAMSRGPIQVNDPTITTVGERLIARAVNGSEANVAQLVEEAKATYGDEGLPLLREGAARLLADSDDHELKGRIGSLWEELERIAQAETAAEADAKSAAPLSGGAEPNIDLQ